MISPIAIALALAFWAPYNNGQPVCPSGVHITYEQPGPNVTTAWVDVVPNPDCAMHIRADIAGQQIPYQCMIIAHELGHAAMGLPDSTEQGNIMFGPMAIPGACYPSTPRIRRAARSGTVRRAHRPSGCSARTTSDRTVLPRPMGFVGSGCGHQARAAIQHQEHLGHLSAA